MNRTRTLAAVAVLALLATACGGGGGGGGSATTATAAARPSSTATLAIVEPANEATVAPGTLTVRLDLQGAHIVDAATTTLEPDEGHVHINLDGKLVSMAYGLEQQVDVAPGVHVLVAEFVAGDHAPFNPRVAVTRTFAVAAPT
jgi:ABC-type transport system substrate-binding protein